MAKPVDSARLRPAHWPGPPAPGETDPHHEREIRFLRGPQRRSSELLRTLRIVGELIRGFRKLHFVGPCVTVFGSARTPEDHPWYELARRIGGELARAGFTVMTGGGPGIMEAASRGAKEAGGRTVGCNIRLPKEQEPNPWLDTMVEFRYFFLRKVMLVKYSYAFIALPGGYGTMDEIFEAATLIQTGKIRNFPLILMGREFWQPLLEWFREHPLQAGNLSAEDLELLHLTDDPREAAAGIREKGLEEFGLSYGPRARRSWLLGEGSAAG